MASATSAETATNGDGDGGEPDATAPRAPAAKPGRERGYHLEIFLISFASLLLEISYTRVVSFKLFYYYTYLVIGLALLGIGCGSVITSISGRLKRARTDTIMIVGCLVGAVSVVLGYLVVARLPIASLALWDYGRRDSFVNFAALLALCLALFASFVWIGVMVSTLFGRKTEGIGKLYFADLVGAGAACLVVVWFIASIGPPRTIALAGAVLAGVGVYVAVRSNARAWVAPVGGVLTAGLALCVVAAGVLPDVRPDEDKSKVEGADYSKWSPIFRVDTAHLPNGLLLNHDGMLGSVIKPWDGDVDSLEADVYNFDGDPRSYPFDLLGEPPERVMIIGAAGGHEILTSLYFDAENIDAIELNPLTYDLVTDVYADFGGHVADQPGVNYVTGDGRSFLARSEDEYELIWYPAPDSYSATNAATAGAFVLSESYLYTKETIEESLDHLNDDGIVATQFGELDYDGKPNRTTRYVATVRAALEEHGVDDPSQHVLVATSSSGGQSVLSTVLVKKTPFTQDEIASFQAKGADIEGNTLRYAPGQPQDNTVTAVLTLPADEQRQWLDDYGYDVDAISDDGPFFWHFARFGDVLRDFPDRIVRADPEDSIGERVLILLLVIAATLAAVFLLLPFVTMRKVWRELPRKPTSAAYFTALGFGFMFFEITLIQRLVLFLGYPTYSLTVTLASLLMFTGIGALLSARLKGHVQSAAKAMAVVVVALGLAYLFLLPMLTDALLTAALGVRVIVAFLVLAPLGLLLGMFMPLGLGAVSALTGHGQEYVAWGWAVNGFASVIGSVLTTIIAMMFGFNVVLALATVTYLLALVALWRLQRPVAIAPGADGEAGVAGDGEVAEPAEEVAVGAGPAGAGPVGATTP
jgi:spermidine synthase